MEPDRTVDRMKQDWNVRAVKDAEFFIAKTTDHAAFDASAQADLTDLLNGIDGFVTRDARVLDLGCGIGRLIKPLAPLVGEIHGVDVSGEMIRRARSYLTDISNVVLHENSGSDLAGLDSSSFDLAYSYLMFQHIPDRDVVKAYLRETHRVLKVGGAFKFQVDGRGDRPLWRAYRALRAPSSWRGALWTRDGIVEATREAGLDVIDCAIDQRDRLLMRYAYLWVTCVKRS